MKRLLIEQDKHKVAQHTGLEKITLPYPAQGVDDRLSFKG